MRVRHFAYVLMLLILIPLFFAAGCAKPTGNDTATLGLCLPIEADGWEGLLLDAAREAAAQQGIQNIVETVSSTLDGVLEDSVRELINLDVSVVIMYAQDAQQCEKAAEMLAEANVPLVLLGNGIDSLNYTAIVTADDEAIGRAAALAIAGRIEGNGAVLVLEDQPCEETRLRNKGFEEALAAYPAIEIVAFDSAGGRADIAAETVEAWMDMRNIDAIFSHNDEMAIGAIGVLQERLRDDVQIVTGIGGRREALDMIMKNNRYFKATYAYFPAEAAAQAIGLAVRLMSGEEVVKEHVLPLIEITALNAGDYYDPNSSY